MTTHSLRPRLSKHQKDSIESTLMNTDLTRYSISRIHGVSYTAVDKVIADREIIRTPPEPENFEVLKIKAEFLDDAIAILKEFGIIHEKPNPGYELFEKFNSKINQIK